MNKAASNRRAESYRDALRAATIERQKIYLHEKQEQLGMGPTDMARFLDTNINTYKAWLYGKNPMPGVVRLALYCTYRNRPEG